jgi:hypothetical protein
MEPLPQARQFLWRTAPSGTLFQSVDNLDLLIFGGVYGSMLFYSAPVYYGNGQGNFVVPRSIDSH